MKRAKQSQRGRERASSGQSWVISAMIAKWQTGSWKLNTCKSMVNSWWPTVVLCGRSVTTCRNSSVSLASGLLMEVVVVELWPTRSLVKEIVQDRSCIGLVSKKGREKVTKLAEVCLDAFIWYLFIWYFERLLFDYWRIESGTTVVVIKPWFLYNQLDIEAFVRASFQDLLC